MHYWVTADNLNWKKVQENDFESINNSVNIFTNISAEEVIEQLNELEDRDISHYCIEKTVSYPKKEPVEEIIYFSYPVYFGTDKDRASELAIKYNKIFIVSLQLSKISGGVSVVEKIDNEKFYIVNTKKFFKTCIREKECCWNHLCPIYRIEYSEKKAKAKKNKKAKKAEKVQIDCLLSINPEQYVSDFNSVMLKVVFKTSVYAHNYSLDVLKKHIKIVNKINKKWHLDKRVQSTIEALNKTYKTFDLLSDKQLKEQTVQDKKKSFLPIVKYLNRFRKKSLVKKKV